jgi:vancomycin permeability regulator SanA
VYRERILAAIALYEAKKVNWIILTGGTPRAG